MQYLNLKTFRVLQTWKQNSVFYQNFKKNISTKYFSEETSIDTE